MEPVLSRRGRMSPTLQIAASLIGSALTNGVLFQFIMLSAKTPGSKCVKPRSVVSN